MPRRPAQRPGNQPGQTFLLVGSDSREGLSKAEQKRLGTGSTRGQRTDTIMIVYSPPGGKPVLISVPRDSFLPIPDNGSNKINAAYAFGGPQLLVATVEQNTGLRVDGYLEIGFGGFVNIIDALGGIEMCLPKAIKDRDAHINLPKGCQTLSGVDALGYVRMRKADPRGDLGRVERQREMLAAIADKAASPASVLNPVRYWNLCNAATGGDQDRRGHLAAAGDHARPGHAQGLRRERPHPDRADLRLRARPRRPVPPCCGTTRRPRPCSPTSPAATPRPQEVRQVAQRGRPASSWRAITTRWIWLVPS